MGLNIAINRAKDITKGENKVLEALKKVYLGVEHEVYIYAQSIISNKRPDFIIIDSKRGIAILEVKDWSEEYVKSVNKRKVNLLDMECDNPIVQVRGYKNILCSALFSREFDSIDSDDIGIGIVLTNMNEDALKHEKLSLLFNSELKYLFKNDISDINLDKIFEGNNVNYTDDDLKRIRISIFPEIEIVSVEENGYGNVDIKSLDFEQEEFAKKIPIGHYMVTGVPGSGKTVILLSRAIHLIKENPNWKILILTYNKSLSNKLNSKLNKIAEIFKNDINNREINIENIEIRHFHGEVARILGGMRKPFDISNDVWFREESVNMASKKAYNLYDAILIDEYQDFYMNWIELCVKLCKEYTLDDSNKKLKNIFLAGDRLQSIYNNKDISWKSIGIDMRGRSKLLKTSYRSAKQHMSLGLDLLKSDKTLKLEVEKFYKDEFEDTELEALNTGSVEFMNSNFDSIGDKILELKEQGYKNEDFLILAGTKNICMEIKNRASQKIKDEMNYVKDLDSTNIRDNIILTTYHSSKGLEAKIVFLTSMDSIFVGNNISENEKLLLKRKIIYVGITRASEKLYIHSKLNEDSSIIKELKNL